MSSNLKVNLPVVDPINSFDQKEHISTTEKQIRLPTAPALRKSLPSSYIGLSNQARLKIL
jgi:hypothetical protein